MKKRGFGFLFLVWVILNIMSVPLAYSSRDDVQVVSKAIKLNLDKMGGWGKLSPISSVDNGVEEFSSNEKIVLLSGKDDVLKLKTEKSNIVLISLLCVMISLLLCVQFFTNRKSQISVYIIIGVVVLIGIITVTYIRQSTQTGQAEERIERATTAPFDKEQFNAFIESCIRDVSEPLLDNISYNGGTLNVTQYRMYYDYYFNESYNPDDPPKIYYPVKYNYHCINDPSQQFGCINQFYSRPKIQAELNGAILNGLKECIDLQRFKRQFTITNGSMNVTTKIGVTDIDVTLNWPLTVSKGDYRDKMEEFSVKFHIELGKMIDLAANITNNEIKGRIDGETYFDTDDWMFKHGAEIKIYRHKLYPDTLYKLKKYNKRTQQILLFHFAIQNDDTIGKVGQKLAQPGSFGVCRTPERGCYENTPSAICQDYDSFFHGSMPDDCNGLSTYSDQMCSGRQCRDCGSDGKGGIYKHGESWCEYDGLVGNGMDYVGSRHYRRMCIDGEMFFEECRDYREELCTSYQEGYLRRAACRTNRWQDCTLQRNKTRCLNRQKRDCVWDENLTKADGKPFGGHGMFDSNPIARNFSNDRCHPYVAPGLKFWQPQSMTVCQLAYEQWKCDWYSCPTSWTDSTAMYCHKQGDCGNYYNIMDNFTDRGFANSNGGERRSVYPPAGFAWSGWGYNITLPHDARRPIFLRANEPYGNMIENAERLMDNVNVWLNWASRQKKSKHVKHYIKPFPFGAPHAKIHYYSLHTGLCSLWMPPDGGNDCGQCNVTPNKPCTEYRCMSLGSSCQYEETGGRGFCYDASANDSDPPQIFFNQSLLGQNHTAICDYGLLLPGYYGCVIRDDVEPFTTVQFGFDTDEDAKCKIWYLPRTPYTVIIDVDEDLNYTTQHIRQEFIIPIKYIKDHLMNVLDMVSLLEVKFYDSRIENEMQKMIGNTMLPADFRQDAQEALDEYRNDIKPQIDAFLDSIRDIKDDILMNIEENRVFKFIKCRDKAGNENQDDIYVSYRVGDDESSAVILSSDPENGATLESNTINLTIRLSEPAQCRFNLGYDGVYDTMTKEMECETGGLFIGTGNFKCHKKNYVLPATEKKHIFYIRCIDQPMSIEKYGLKIIGGGSLSVDPMHDFGEIEAQPPSTFDVKDAGFLVVYDGEEEHENELTVLHANQSTVDVVLNFRRPKMCKYTTDVNDEFDIIGSTMDCTVYPATCKMSVTQGEHYMFCVDQEQPVRNPNDKSTRIEVFTP